MAATRDRKAGQAKALESVTNHRELTLLRLAGVIDTAYAPLQEDITAISEGRGHPAEHIASSGIANLQ